MHTIDLTYVGRGIHEELIAYVADQEGYFEEEGVHVQFGAVTVMPRDPPAASIVTLPGKTDVTQLCGPLGGLCTTSTGMPPIVNVPRRSV